MWVANISIFPRFLKMHCSICSHYKVSFHHNELISVGFNPAEINLLYETTNRVKVKVHVMWDRESNPHFTYQSGRNALVDIQSGDRFYRSFVKWVYNKTRIRGHRLIHDGKHVNLLFDHSSANINPSISIPNYDFSGFYASGYPLHDENPRLSFNLIQSKSPRKSPRKSENPALVRICGKSPIDNSPIF